MEKLQVLKTPEERRRKLKEIPEIHADPKMDPSYESDENDPEAEDSRRGFLHFHIWWFEYCNLCLVVTVYVK